MKILKRHKGAIVGFLIVAVLLAISYFLPTSTAPIETDIEQRTKTELYAKSQTKVNDIKSPPSSADTENKSVEAQIPDIGNEQTQSAKDLANEYMETEITAGKSEESQTVKDSTGKSIETKAPVADNQKLQASTDRVSTTQALSLDKEHKIPAYIGQKNKHNGIPNKKSKSVNPIPSEENTEEAERASYNTELEKDRLTCSLSVDCHTILDNMDKVEKEKRQLIPSDGILYHKEDVIFYEEETAFNVLLREMKQNRIHFEFENTPMYDSIYIEGIGNIYEFDAGDLSGWLYRVNGKFLSYGLSKYYVKNGDKIEIVFTCNMGEDLGAPRVR